MKKEEENEFTLSSPTGKKLCWESDDKTIDWD